jgi:hypothetical protein
LAHVGHDCVRLPDGCCEGLSVASVVHDTVRVFMDGERLTEVLRAGVCVSVELTLVLPGSYVHVSCTCGISPGPQPQFSQPMQTLSQLAPVPGAELSRR